MNQIEWKSKARKDLKRIDKAERVKILDAVDGLADFSRNPNIKKLVNHGCDYRLRVGNYRILFNHESVIKVVSIERVRKRDGKTY
ncbi:MAG: type II toxin-antitoxin system RelE/ParE family toxin [Gammaproteobacteria bacterium]|nr:type II toxin-antitoxin system RelE/ParE family toxin [Gammaproteobacteria bacterium]